MSDNETIAPPRWWITFTPYGTLEWCSQYGYYKETMIHFMYTIYLRENLIFLLEWKEKYVLRQAIKELMER
jgi:hypothetical protein